MATGKSSKKKKKDKEDGLKFAIIIVIALIIILGIYIITQSQGSKDPTPTQAPTPTTIVLGTTNTPVPDTNPTDAPAVATQTPNPTEATATKAPEATSTPEPTPVPTTAVEPTAVPATSTPLPEITPTPTAVPRVTVDEAKAVVTKKVDTNLYTVALMNDQLNVDGTDYFMYAVYEKSTGKPFSSFLIVSKQSGDIYYYENGTISEFDKFPPDSTSIKDPSQETGTVISADKAYKLLCTIDKDTLMLVKAPSEYVAEYDKEAIVTVNGKNCYEIFLFETTNGKRVLRGDFFVSEDGLDCYVSDPDTGEFRPIPIG